ncbi:MAG: uracil-DNA glycosylase [Bacteroidetes bacterium]|nr:uracil-DNA glycosylase [Bacteroidota bacterium]
MNVKIEQSWKALLDKEFSKTYFREIVAFLKIEKLQKKTICPPGSLLFNAFNLTPFEDVKVVILGQDPYHGWGQAHGLSFSVPDGVTPPPSLQNIFKEIMADLGVSMPRQQGNLTQWAEQGVLLLNAFLSVRLNEPLSHSKIGWETFTDTVIRLLSEKKEGLVFLLWGKFAQQKQSLIDENKHYVLKAAHPSPFSADKGFFGCRHFSLANEYLMRQRKSPINWKLS